LYLPSRRPRTFDHLGRLFAAASQRFTVAEYGGYMHHYGGSVATAL
jgi:hypothetical protein